MAAVMVTLNAGSNSGGSAHVLSTQALYLAESGLDDEQRRLARNVDWYRSASDPFDLATVSVAQGNYTVSANVPATEMRTQLTIGGTTLNVFGGGTANRWPASGTLLIDDFTGDPEFVSYSSTAAASFTLSARNRTVGTVSGTLVAHSRGDSVFPVTTLSVALTANCTTIPSPFTIANHSKLLDYGTLTIFHDAGGTVVSEQVTYSDYSVSGATRTLLGVQRCQNGTVPIAASIGDPVAPMVSNVGTNDFEAIVFSTGIVGAAQRREFKIVQR
jgi:hypothetical protein